MSQQLLCFDLAFIALVPSRTQVANYECPQNGSECRIVMDLTPRQFKLFLRGNQVPVVFVCQCGRDHWATVAFAVSYEAQQRSIANAEWVVWTS